MIRTHFNAPPPKRRIAVIQIPRPQRARMGSIGNGQPAGPGVAYTTVSLESPDSSANWMSLQMLRQAAAAQNTPGTLIYTPANNTPAANVAPWNSWLSPNCPPAADSSVSTAAAVTASLGKFGWLWLAAGVVGGLASMKYILADDKGRK